MTELPTAAVQAVIPELDREWLKARRWFSSKGQTIAAIEVTDWGALPLAEPGVLAIALVHYQSGRSEHYLLPLIASPEAQPAGTRTPPAATLTHAGTTWYVHDAFQFAAFQRLLMEYLIAGVILELQRGQVVFRPEAALRAAPPPLAEIRLVTAEQSNSSIIYDRQAILKCFRRVVAGINPDVEVSQFLSRVGFQHTPALLGSMAYVTHDDVEHSLGMLQAFVPNEGDAWEHTLRLLADFLHAAQARPEVAGAALDMETRELAAAQLDELRQLGRLTGELHLALASDPNDPEFAPRHLQGEHIAAWQGSIRRQADDILRALAQRQGELPPEQQQDVAALLGARDQIERRVDALRQLADAEVVLTRYHGDYHLGQVLASERGFLILDFEGEPLRSLAERRAHGSPLKDVAGMLRSLSYAAQTGLRAANASAQLEPWVEAWERSARAAFLDGYHAVTQEAAFVPQPPELMHSALAVFELEKALYELNYELNNRPDWLPIPLRGIQRAL